MKKLLLFTLIFTFILSFVSCSDENVSNSTSDSASISTPLKEEETTGTINDAETETTATETTTTEDIVTTESDIFPPHTEQTTQTTSTSNSNSDTSDYSTTETTTILETTDPIDRYELGMEYVRNYEAYIVTGGEEYAPYTSTIYCQNPYMTSDGILMFFSMENQLPYWVKDDVIPYIDIDADSDVHFEYHRDTELKHTGRFRLYIQDENGSFYQAAELLNSNLKEVYAYGKENFADKTVYISYPFMLQYGDYSHLTDGIWGDHAVHDIMCVFKTSF